MQKQVATLSVITLTLISILIGVGYFYVQNKLDTSNSQVVKTDTSKQKKVAKQNQAQSSSELQVQGAQTTQPNAQSSLPEPAEFSIYEQFSSAQNTQYIDVVTGTGVEATAEDVVAVVYSGYLTSGQLFDQSRRNVQNEIEPFVFKIGAKTVIQGWEEGIVGMKEGGQRRLIIPSQLAYGAEGAADGAIPPNAMLIFDVQLAQVQKSQQQGL